MCTSQIVTSAASFSWIDPKTGLPGVDKGGAGRSIHRDEIFTGARFRFANYLEAVVDINDKLGIVRAVAGKASAMYRRPSFLRLKSAPVGGGGRSARHCRAPAARLLRQGYGHDGNDAQLKAWKAKGWGATPAKRGGATPGNPWGMTDPGPVPGTPKLPRQLPAGYDSEGK